MPSKAKPLLPRSIQILSKIDGISLEEEADIVFKTTKRKASQAAKAKYKFIDLFAGIGGFHIAFEKNRCGCVYANEWNDYCQVTYFKNFGMLPEGDITKVDAASIPDHDILAGGFPCQPFSIAGISKKKSLGRETGFRDKTQGTLFFDICRIIEAKRPKAFLLENVKNLVSHDKGKTFEIIRESLDKLGYAVFWKILDGKDYTPQHRERIVIVGFDRKRYGDDVSFEFDLRKPERQAVLSDILQENVDPKYTINDHLWAYFQEYAARQKSRGNGFGYGLAKPSGTTRTLSARYYKDGAEILVEQEGKNPRRLTPRECARLQGYPEDFIIPVSDHQSYRQFGNSVVVPLMTEVARLIVKKLDQLESGLKA